MSRYIAAVLRRGPVRWVLAVLIAVVCVQAVSAQTAPTIMRVEQDWELVVGVPDAGTDSPQVVCVLSPQGDVNSIYGAFELNQRSQPSFHPGGLQLQIWDGELPLQATTSAAEEVISQPQETICWTQSMTLLDGVLTFEISGGTSTTWGDFGGDALRLSVPTTLADLSGYDCDVSVRNSGVGFAANRVQSLVMKKVRLFASTGEQFEDDNEKVVH